MKWSILILFISVLTAVQANDSVQEKRIIKTNNDRIAYFGDLHVHTNFYSLIQHQARYGGYLFISMITLIHNILKLYSKFSRPSCT